MGDVLLRWGRYVKLLTALAHGSGRCSAQVFYLRSGLLDGARDRSKLRVRQEDGQLIDEACDLADLRGQPPLRR